MNKTERVEICFFLVRLGYSLTRLAKDHLEQLGRKSNSKKKNNKTQTKQVLSVWTDDDEIRRKGRQGKPHLTCESFPEGTGVENSCTKMNGY